MSAQGLEQLARIAADLSVFTGQAYGVVLTGLVLTSDLLAMARREGAERGWDEGYNAGWIDRSTGAGPHANPHREPGAA